MSQEFLNSGFLLLVPKNKTVTAKSKDNKQEVMVKCIDTNYSQYQDNNIVLTALKDTVVFRLRDGESPIFSVAATILSDEIEFTISKETKANENEEISTVIHLNLVKLDDKILEYCLNTAEVGYTFDIQINKDKANPEVTVKYTERS